MVRSSTAPSAITARLVSQVKIVNMAEEEAPTQVAPAKVAKKKKTSKTVKAGPSLRDLIKNAVSASKERSGVSLAGIKKDLKAAGYDADKNKSRVRTAIIRMVADGVLTQVKGSGASGSFKITKKEAPKAKKAAPKAKSAAIKKPAAAKKTKTAAKAAVAKKSPKKVTKKPAAKKAAPKSPRKAAKTTAAKSPRKAAKKPAAKKSPAKKVVKPKAKKATPKKK